jgi:hypothetical protein
MFYNLYYVSQIDNREICVGLTHMDKGSRNNGIDFEIEKTEIYEIN